MYPRSRKCQRQCQIATLYLIYIATRSHVRAQRLVAVRRLLAVVAEHRVFTAKLIMKRVLCVCVCVCVVGVCVRQALCQLRPVVLQHGAQRERLVFVWPAKVRRRHSTRSGGRRDGGGRGGQVVVVVVRQNQRRLLRRRECRSGRSLVCARRRRVHSTAAR